MDMENMIEQFLWEYPHDEILLKGLSDNPETYKKLKSLCINRIETQYIYYEEMIKQMLELNENIFKLYDETYEKYNNITMLPQPLIDFLENTDEYSGFMLLPNSDNIKSYILEEIYGTHQVTEYKTSKEYIIKLLIYLWQSMY